MKYTILAAFAASTLAATAAQVAVSGDITGTTTVGSGDFWQSNGTTTTIKSGGTLAITTPQWETIIQQNAAGTSTMTVETGGTLDFSGATGNGTTFFVGNANGTGILNLDGGTLDGATLTNFTIGRAGANGTFNINAGTANVGNLTVDNGGAVNFGTDSTGTLTVTGADTATFQTLWDQGKLTFGGANEGTFTDHFKVEGSTLSVVPEPSSTALLGLGGLALILRRRK